MSHRHIIIKIIISTAAVSIIAVAVLFLNSFGVVNRAGASELVVANPPLPSPPEKPKNEYPSPSLNEGSSFMYLPVLNKAFPKTPIFSDNFSTDKGWIPDGSEGVERGLDNEHYFMRDTYDLSFRTVRTYAPTQAEDTPDSFFISLAGKMVEGDTVANAYGIVLFDRFDEGKQVMFIIHPGAQTFRIYRFDAGYFLLDSGVSGAILLNNAPNRMRLTVDGDQIQAIVNGTVLSTVTVSNFSTGRVGLDLWNFAPPVEARYDDFQFFEK